MPTSFTSRRPGEPDALGLTLADYERLAAESRAAQGLPPKITDPALLDHVVEWVRAGEHK